ncbi:MAG: glycosyltransferase family 4 protein [Chloroflexota bacterium]
MRILMISRCPPWPLHLGDRLIVYNLARELSTMGVTIDLLALAELASDWSQTEQNEYTKFFHDVMLFDAQRRPPIELARRALFPAARFPTTPENSFLPELWREIERRLAATAYDAVHLFGGVQIYDFAQLLNGLHTVITPYESYSLYTRRVLARGGGGWWQSLKHRLNHTAAGNFESWMFAPYNVTTVVSENDRDELLALAPDLRVEVIPNGVQLERFMMLKRRRKPAQLLFVGNYEYEPNRDAALWLAREIFPRVRESVPAARLWLVGNGPTAEMQALASEYIEVTGRVDDVCPYYTEATVFVCPLRVGAGIKNKVLEALAMGCPVVATPLSVDGIAVADGESYLRGQTAAELAAQTVRLLTDVQLPDALRENGRQVILDGYSWQGVAARYMALYRDGDGAS